MDRTTRLQVRSTADEVNGWVRAAAHVLDLRTRVDNAAGKAEAALRQRVVDVRLDSGAQWVLLPLGSADESRLASIARCEQLPSLSEYEEIVLGRLAGDARRAITDARKVTGARRLITGTRGKEIGALGSRYLGELQEWGHSANVATLLDSLTTTSSVGVSRVDPSQALAEAVGLSRRLADLGAGDVLPAGVIAGLTADAAALETALRDEVNLRAAVEQAGAKVRERAVASLVEQMPVERLREASKGQIRVSALRNAGIATIADVRNRKGRLDTLPGIGATSAMRIEGAAHTIWQTTYDEMPVRIDLKERPPETTELLRAMRAWDGARKARHATADIEFARAVAHLARALTPSHTAVAVLSHSSNPEQLVDAIRALRDRVAGLGPGVGESPTDPWDDFITRPADYFAMLSELGFLTEDDEKAHGDLPAEIVEAVRALSLDTEHLNASLRGYQSFGARFALVQRKVIIGDEMGLGKTIEALAVLSHLRAKGKHHFVVVCPAAVVTNWMREIAAKSRLRPHRVHGVGREPAARAWDRNGGVAVTTFETLGWFGDHAARQADLGCVVVDEAHYIKNPAAQRTGRTRRLLDATDRAVLLTGTPLENRIDEFASLVKYLRPDLVVRADELAPRRFRKEVAPAYLRRNQEDVLVELPELIEVEEWLPLSTADWAQYRAAVSDGNFMAMRKAAMTSGRDSAKAQRLVEIVREAEANGRRVLVFSHFLDVLAGVTQMLPGRVFGPLTGSVAAHRRQEMIDEFSKAGGGAVLVSQIVAGGVGLNIQAASVVVICEPQLKPTTEWQAIARAHRMGQLDSVQVHRLLSEDGVDERITEILTRKKELFQDFARVSEAAQSAPEAFDITEAELAREIMASERERLLGGIAPAT